MYWLISSIGLFDLDTDVDVDVDLDVDSGFLNGALRALLNFVNATDIPLMLVLTMLSGLGLVLNVFLTSLLNTKESIWIAIPLIILSFIIACVLTHYITLVLRPAFKVLSDDSEKHQAIIGRVGTVKSGTLDQKFGQIEVPHENSSPTLLNSILPEHYAPLSKGDKVLVTSHNSKAKVYVVRPAEEFADILNKEEEVPLLFQSELEDDSAISKGIETKENN